MAQVRYEIAAYGLQPTELGHVVDQGDRAHRLACSPQGKGPDLQGMPSGGVEIERFLVVRPSEGSAQGRLYRLVGQQVTVAGVYELAGRGIAQEDRPVFIADDDPLAGLVRRLDQQGEQEGAFWVVVADWRCAQVASTTTGA